MQDYKAEAVFCKKEGDCDKQILHGKWTNIYDQAFDVELENGIRFIANLRYSIKNKLSADPVKQARQGLESFGTIGSDDYDKFDSVCGQTMVGFVQNVNKPSSLAQHNIQCFHGVQKKHYDIEKTKSYDNGKVKYNKIIKTNEITPVNLLDTKSSAGSKKAAASKPQ